MKYCGCCDQSKSNDSFSYGRAVCKSCRSKALRVPDDERKPTYVAPKKSWLPGEGMSRDMVYFLHRLLPTEKINVKEAAGLDSDCAQSVLRMAAIHTVQDEE